MRQGSSRSSERDHECHSSRSLRDASRARPSRRAHSENRRLDAAYSFDSRLLIHGMTNRLESPRRRGPSFGLPERPALLICLVHRLVVFAINPSRYFIFRFHWSDKRNLVGGRARRKTTRNSDRQWRRGGHASLKRNEARILITYFQLREKDIERQREREGERGGARINGLVDTPPPRKSSWPESNVPFS